MPSAKLSSFKSGGILRKVDATILDIQFTDKPGVFEKAGVVRPVSTTGKKPFRSLFGVVTFQVDGSESTTDQPLFVGDADKFGVTEDGHGVTGRGDFGRSTGWYIFYQTLVKPSDGGDGFDESLLLEATDDEGYAIANYSAIIGARVHVDQLENAEMTKKGKFKIDKKDPTKKYPYTDTIVTAYYGQVDVQAPVRPAKIKATGPRKAAAGAKPNGKAATTPAVDLSAIGAEKIIIALTTAAKKDADGQPDLTTAVMSKAKMQIKLLSVMATDNQQLRDSVREWATVSENLAAIDGVKFNAETGMLSLSE